MSVSIGLSLIRSALFRPRLLVYPRSRSGCNLKFYMLIAEENDGLAACILSYLTKCGSLCTLYCDIWCCLNHHSK